MRRFVAALFAVLCGVSVVQAEDIQSVISPCKPWSTPDGSQVWEFVKESQCDFATIIRIHDFRFGRSCAFANGRGKCKLRDQLPEEGKRLYDEMATLRKVNPHATSCVSEVDGWQLERAGVHPDCGRKMQLRRLDTKVGVGCVMFAGEAVDCFDYDPTKVIRGTAMTN